MQRQTTKAVKPPKDLMTAEELKGLREALGFTQKQMAEALSGPLTELRGNGIRAGMVGHLETGYSEFGRVYQLAAIAVAEAHPDAPGVAELLAKVAKRRGA